MLQRGALKNNVAKDMAALRQKSSINITEKAFSDAYNKFVETYLKDQAAKGGS